MHAAKQQLTMHDMCHLSPAGPGVSAATQQSTYRYQFYSWSIFAERLTLSETSKPFNHFAVVTLCRTGLYAAGQHQKHVVSWQASSVDQGFSAAVQLH